MELGADDVVRFTPAEAAAYGAELQLTETPAGVALREFHELTRQIVEYLIGGPIPD